MDPVIVIVITENYCIHQVVSIYLHFSGDKQSIIGLRSGMLLFFCKIIASPQFVRQGGGWVIRVKGVSNVQHCPALSLHSNQEIGLKQTNRSAASNDREVLRVFCFIRGV